MSSESIQHPLDEVIWRALNGVQSSIAEGDVRARRYPAPVAPFAAMSDLESASFESLRALIGTDDDRIALFAPVKVQPPSMFTVLRRDVVDQMILVEPRACVAAETPIEALGVPDVPEMLVLAGVTQPGPFGPRTIELGEYRGVRRRGRLVAMAGERMRLDGFTEISAVCVDTAHRGQGLAADLVGSLVASIVARFEIPFLHVFTSNHPAIALYRKLGFALRRRMHLAVLGSAEARRNRSFKER